MVLKSGRTTSDHGGKINLTPVTVFVGPNNSGKSKVLAEIAAYCRMGSRDTLALILDNLTLLSVGNEVANRALASVSLSPNIGESLAVGHTLVKTPHGRQQVPTETLLSSIRNPQSQLAAFCQWFLCSQTMILDGQSRINLINDQPAGDLQQSPHSSFQVLLRDDDKRREVRRIVFEAFGFHFVLDPTNLGHLRIRLSPRAPHNDMEERGIHDQAVKFHSLAQHISVASDGVKAFTGIITEIIAGDPHVLLIDEPEAFLHPSLASKLGYEISRAGTSTDKRVFVSTHSPAFVMGCIQSGAPVNIIRLTYRNGAATTRMLPSKDILQLMRNPLLRSTGVLSGLFYEFVVVTESDADRAFYQEINERLLRFKPDWGIPNCLFLNAQNKQTVQTIIAPLRELGIPAVGVVDVDVLKDGGKTWTNLLRGANVPELSHSSLANLRSSVKTAMDSTGKDMKRDGGVAILESSDQEAACGLLLQLADYGIFVVPGGELESWLKSLGSSGHGPSWLIEIFEKMGEDPDSEAFLKPAESDVWLFLKKIRDWLINPERKGIPT